MQTPDSWSTLWTGRRGSLQVVILARLLPRSLEAGVEMGGLLLYTFTFETEAALQAWVKEKRQELEGEGWTKV